MPEAAPCPQGQVPHGQGDPNFIEDPDSVTPQWRDTEQVTWSLRAIQWDNKVIPYKVAERLKNSDA